MAATRESGLVETRFYRGKTLVFLRQQVAPTHGPCRHGTWQRFRCAPWQRLSALGMTGLMAMVAVSAAASPAIAQQVIDRRKEYNVKAAYVYSFGRYVTWPAESFQATNDQFVIGIVGDSPLAEPLTRIAKVRKIMGHQIEIRRFSTLAEYHPCQILFIAGPTSTEIQQQLAQLRLHGVLVVGESVGFATRGGAINFRLELESVRFEINVEAARAQGLQMGAKLLTLGRPIKSP